MREVFREPDSSFQGSASGTHRAPSPHFDRTEMAHEYRDLESLRPERLEHLYSCVFCASLYGAIAHQPLPRLW